MSTADAKHYPVQGPVIMPINNLKSIQKDGVIILRQLYTPDQLFLLICKRNQGNVETGNHSKHKPTQQPDNCNC